MREVHCLLLSKFVTSFEITLLGVNMHELQRGLYNTWTLDWTGLDRELDHGLMIV